MGDILFMLGTVLALYTTTIAIIILGIYIYDNYNLIAKVLYWLIIFL